METTDIRAFVRSLDASIESLSANLKPALYTPLSERLAECSLPQEEIKLCQNHLFIVISVLFAYLKVLGVKTEDHPIMKELARIKQSMKDFKDLEERLKRKEDTQTQAREDTKQFLQNTLGTTGGAAAPDSLCSPAISSSNFKGNHTKFTDESDTESPKKSTESIKKPTESLKKPKARKSSGKVTKPRKK